MFWSAKFFQHCLEVLTKRFAGVHARAHVSQAVLALLVFASLSFSENFARAEITAQVAAKDANGYGRIILRFFELPTYRARITDGVLIISFDEPINLTVEQFMKPLQDYFSAGRLDPDSKAIRFALAKQVKLNIIEAGERLFLDLLPQPWIGLPPSLPQDVLDELSAKNRLESEEKRKLARRAAFNKSKKILKVRVGEYPTFSRLVFDWSQKVGVKVSRNGNTLNIQFDKLIRPDITRLKVDPPKFISGAKTKLTDEGLEVDLMLDENTSIRAFREGFTYVVDVSGPLDEAEQKAYSQNRTTLPSGDEVEPAPTSAGGRSEVVEFEAEPPTKPSAKTIKPKTAQVENQARTPQLVVNKASKAGGKSVVVKTEPASGQAEAPKPASMPKQMAAKPEETKPAKSAVMADKTDKTEKTKKTKPLKVEVSLVSGNLSLNFPFAQDVSAAVFQRGDTLWLVFDTQAKLDLSALEDDKEQNSRVASFKILTSGNGVAVLLQLKKPSLTTAAKVGYGWLVSVGDFIVTPVKPINLVSGMRVDGLPKLTANLEKPAIVHVFEDPLIGDELVVVTAFGPPQGIVKSRRFVEFSTIATAHGIAVQSSVDDLKVSVNPDNVVISSVEGLLLSRVEGGGNIRSIRAAVDVLRPGKIDFDQWAQGGAAKFHARRAELEREIADVTEQNLTIALRMELARLYVGNQLGAEALGTMDVLKAIDPKVENDPLFHAVRGVANLMMYRLKAARLHLTSRGLINDKDAQLWMGLLEVAEGNWVKARLNFTNGESSLKNYPEKIKALFRIRAARANIEVNDISNARYQLAAMPKINLERKFIAEAAFLNGRILELLTRNEEALDYYNEALSYGDRKVESEASFFKTMLEFRLGNIKADAALEQLESQLIVWRGDEVELKVMRELAKLYVARNSFRRGLETMRTATTYYPNEKIGRLIQDDMAALFKELFLGEKIKTMPPIEALSLYYDFRELTPIGRLGDEMIRKLSDTLITVDLLDQAAEILSHQVEKRLKGAARAQVATKLAMVHMFRRQPQKALTAIRRTRQAVLPKTVSRRRSLIEARALAELGRFELAISTLANLEGRDIEQARATALWQGESWQGAGEAYERYLGNAWEVSGALTDAQRVDVLRAAIAYTLADDTLGTERLATKFADKMAATADAQTFAVITSSNGGQEAEFRNIARQIASIDTLRGFLKEFRKAEQPLSEDAAAVPQS